jgi:electron transfer flavoprotein beta subunit
MSMEREVFVCVKPAMPLAESPGAAPRPVRNEANAFAVEEALRARDRGEVERVTCLCVGPPRAREALVAALAMGADRALRIDVPEAAGLDAGATAALLAAAIRSLGGRLVFAAQASDDERSGLVPAFLARGLDAAYLSNAVTFRLMGAELEIQRRAERGDRQVWAAALPAVVAFDRGINVPRYPRVAERLRARRQAIEETRPDALGADLGALPRLVKLLRLEPLRRRPKKVALPASEGSAADRMRALVVGGVTAKASKVVTGPIDRLVEVTVSFLKERRLLDEGRQTTAALQGAARVTTIDG